MSITVFTKPGCVQCVATERTLAARNIAFELIDLTADSGAYDFVQSNGYRQAPVVVAGDQHWGGFQPGKIDALEQR